jgi:hypothetical protein
MMLTFPVAMSTNCTCPDVRPGKAIVLSDMLHSPSKLSAVSYAEMRSGGLEKEYTRTLFCSTTTMRFRASCTPRTAVSVVISSATLPLLSSQRMTLFWANFGCLPPPTRAR